MADMRVNQAFADMAAQRAQKVYNRRRPKRELKPAAPGDDSQARWENIRSVYAARREADGSFEQRMLRLALRRDTCPSCGALRGERCFRWVQGKFGKVKRTIRGFHKGRQVKPPPPPVRYRTVRKPPPGAVYK